MDILVEPEDFIVGLLVGDKDKDWAEECEDQICQPFNFQLLFIVYLERPEFVKVHKSHIDGTQNYQAYVS